MTDTKDAAAGLPVEPIGEFERAVLYRQQKEAKGLPPYPEVGTPLWVSKPRFEGDSMMAEAYVESVKKADYDALRTYAIAQAERVRELEADKECLIQLVNTIMNIPNMSDAQLSELQANARAALKGVQK